MPVFVVADSAVAARSAAGAVGWTGVTAGTATAAPVPVSAAGVAGVVSGAPVGCGFSEAGGRISPVACGTAGSENLAELGLAGPVPLASKRALDLLFAGLVRQAAMREGPQRLEAGALIWSLCGIVSTILRERG